MIRIGVTGTDTGIGKTVVTCALATALQRLHKLPERPDADGTARLMAAFAPHRSIATMHLWTYLRETKEAA